MTDFVRAVPEFSLIEKYHYRADLRETEITTPKRNGDGSPQFSGRLRVEVPYFSKLSHMRSRSARAVDVEEGVAENPCGFVDAAQWDLDRAREEDGGRRVDQALIGYLGVESICIDKEKAGDNAHAPPPWPLQSGLLPISLPVRDYDECRDAHEKAALLLDYPIGPRPELDVKVSASICSDMDDTHVAFSKGQKLELKLSARHPAIAEWGLRSFSLDWPFECSWAVERDSDFVFDPENEQIVADPYLVDLCTSSLDIVSADVVSHPTARPPRGAACSPG